MPRRGRRRRRRPDVAPRTLAIGSVFIATRRPVAIVAKLLKAVAVKRQVVVATQSPRLLADCAPEDVVVVEREEDNKGYGESTFKRLGADELGDWLKDYDLGALYEMNVTGGGPR